MELLSVWKEDDGEKTTFQLGIKENDAMPSKKDFIKLIKISLQSNVQHCETKMTDLLPKVVKYLKRISSLFYQWSSIPIVVDLIGKL